MDTAKLIKEAGRWAAKLREAPARDEASARLLDYLAAALRESEAKCNAAGLAGMDSADKALKLLRERDDLAAANVAANKRIEGLEHERDEAREWVRKMMRETQTLTCVYCGHAYPPGTPTHGSEVLTAHIEQCERHPARRLVLERDAARAELARLTTPRPIAEAPKDERSRILARGRDGQWREMRLVRGEWRWFGAGNEHIESPSEFLPLPVLP